MSDVILQEKKSFLEYAQRRGLALFPCKQGSKEPALKWKTGSTFDHAQVEAWQAEHKNLAIDWAKSGALAIDIDASKVTRAEAWKAYTDLCESWKLPGPAPFLTNSARGGWHVPFKRPAHLAATDLRGGGTLVKVSNIRPLAEGEKDGEVIGFKNRGYCVAPGSTLSNAGSDLYYRLAENLPDEFPVAPDGLIEAIKLKEIEATYKGEAGTSDKADVAKLVAELDMYGEFATEPDWFKYMGAIKLALGDTEDGVEVALQMTNDDATAEAFWSRWNRLAGEDDGAVRCRIGSMIHRYKQLTGKHFPVRKTMAAMLNGATLPSGPGMAKDVPVVASGPLAPAAFPVPPTAEQKEAERVAALDAVPSLFRTSKQMVTGFVPPDYLIDGVLQRRFCYTHTAQTGVGKTAQDLRIAAHVATGQTLCGLEVQKGTVLYLCGENPTDVQMRWIGLTHEMGLDPDSLDVHFTEGAHKITPEFVELVRHQVTRKGQEIACVIVDTAAAHSPAEEENSNNQQGDYARTLRSFCTLPGGPCVLILCHPTKGAEKINEMLPRGGGSFIAEVDGNLASVKTGDGSIVTAAMGKFRGPEFPPLYFALKGVTVPQLVDSKGKPVPTVIAEPISPGEVQLRETKAVSDNIKVLALIDANPDKSLADIATATGWVGKPSAIKSKVNRIVTELMTAKLLIRDGLTKKLLVTAEGQRSLNRVESTVSHAVSPPPPYQSK